MKRKLFYILSGYALGSIISSLYTDKKGSELRKDLEKAKQAGKDLKKVLFSNFVHTQKKFIDDMQEKVLTEERQDFIDTKREELEKLVAKYREE
jgi:gas vesicle protein